MRQATMSAHTPQQQHKPTAAAPTPHTTRSTHTPATIIAAPKQQAAIAAARGAIRDRPVKEDSSSSSDDEDSNEEGTDAGDGDSDCEIISKSTAAAAAGTANAASTASFASSSVDELASSLGGVQLDRPTPIEIDEQPPHEAATAGPSKPPAPAAVPSASARPPLASSAAATLPAPAAAKPKSFFPKPLIANPLSLAAPIPIALKQKMQAAATNAPKGPTPIQTSAPPKNSRTQPALSEHALKDNPFLSSSVSTIESDLRKQLAFLSGSAALLAGLPDKGATFRLKVAQLEQALPHAQSREANRMQDVHGAASAGAAPSASHAPVAGSLRVHSSTAAAFIPAVSTAEFGSAPAHSHPLFGGRDNKMQTLSMDSAADYMPSAKGGAAGGGKRAGGAQHGYYTSQPKAAASAPVDEDDLLDLMNSLNQLQVDAMSAAPAPAAAPSNKPPAASGAAAFFPPAATSASQPPVAAALPPLVIPGLKPSTSLLPHQVTAVRWMMRREAAGSEPRGGLVADDCGLGKTLQMIALILKTIQEDPALPVVTPVSAPPAPSKSIGAGAAGAASSSSKAAASPVFQLVPSTATLILCPKAVLNSWRLELSKHVADDFCNARGKTLRVLVYHGTEKAAWKESKLLARKCDIVLTTYDTLVREPTIEGASARDVAAGQFGLNGIRWRRVVCDESHTLRNPKTEKAQSVSPVRLHAERRWLMSATPLQNSMDDLYTSMLFLDYRPYSDAARWKALVSKHPSGPRKGLEVLRTLLCVIALRRTKMDRIPGTNQALVALPPKTFEVHRLPFTPREQAFYDELQNAMAHEMEERSFGIDASKQKQKPAASGPQKIVSASSASQFRMSDLLVKLLRLRQTCNHYLLAVEGMKASARAAKAKFSKSNSTSSADHQTSKSTGHKHEARRMEKVLERACAKIALKLKSSSSSAADFDSSGSSSSDGSSGDDDDDAAVCGICLDSLPSSASSILISPRCPHRFCFRCLNPLLEEAALDSGSLDCPVSGCEAALKTKDFKAQIEANGCSSAADKSKGAACASFSVDDLMEDVAVPSAASAASSLSPPDLFATSKLSFVLRHLRSIKSSPSTSSDKVIVFSQWTSMLDLVGRMLDREAERQIDRAQIDDEPHHPRLDWSYTRLDGSQSSKQQHAALVSFQSPASTGRAPSGPSIFLLSLAAGGTGLNLSAANHLFMLDLWWNPGIETQAFDRVYRVGQTKPVFIHKLLIRDSVEERLYEMQQRKLAMAHGVMDAERAGAGSTASVAGSASSLGFKLNKAGTAAGGMTIAELREIFLGKSTEAAAAGRKR